LQVALQYSLLTHRNPVTEEEKASAIAGKVYALQRRLRILTVSPAVAKDHDDVFHGAVLEPLLATLCQKVLVHSLRAGVADARVLLQVCHA
jgi:hypothetical protein